MVQRRQPTSRRTGTGTGTGTGTRTSRIVVAAAAVVVVLLLPPSSLAAAAATGGGGGGAFVAERGDDRGDDPNGGDFRRVLTNAGTQTCIREECDAAWESQIAKCRKAVLASASMSKSKSKSKSRGKQNKNAKQNGKKAKPSQSLRLSLRLCYKSRNNDKLDCIDACRASADDRDRPVHKKCKRQCVLDEKQDTCMKRCDDEFPATDKAAKTVSFRLDRQLCRRECHRAVNRSKSLLACFRACNGVGSRGGTMKPKPTKTTRPNNMMKKTPKPTDPPKETVTPSTDPFDNEDSATSGTSDRYLSSYYGEGGRDDGTPTAAADRYLSNLYGGDGRDAEGEGSGEQETQEQEEDAQEEAEADEDVDIQFYKQMIL